MNSNSPILVTGASGLLGANLVLALRAKNYSVVAVSKNHALQGESIKYQRIDLADSTTVLEFMERERPNCVIHCAALTNLDHCEQNPQEAVLQNAEVPKIIAQAAKKTGAEFIYISTDSVFDGKRGNYTEKDIPHPLNHYASSKLQGEKNVSAISPDNLIVRVNIYGWNAMNKQSLAEWILSQLEKKSPINGFQDVIFNPLLVNDLSDILITMIEKSAKGIFHLGSSDSCSKYEFAVKIAEIFDLDSELVTASSSDNVALKTPRPKITTLNTDKIEKELGIKMPSIGQGIKNFYSLREKGVTSKLKELYLSHFKS